ncbi:hypothetical protein IWX50DRAFT_620975 [Phyllosticta citricarpa]|uniref:Uncharacterized protein n=1 Tax=Phyllosticta citricarpa TaxID=55181 RepID=A0ABR1L248_9PEZI
MDEVLAPSTQRDADPARVQGMDLGQPTPKIGRGQPRGGPGRNPSKMRGRVWCRQHRIACRDAYPAIDTFHVPSGGADRKWSRSTSVRPGQDRNDAAAARIPTDRPPAMTITSKVGAKRRALTEQSQFKLVETPTPWGVRLWLANGKTWTRIAESFGRVSVEHGVVEAQWSIWAGALERPSNQEYNAANRGRDSMREGYGGWLAACCYWFVCGRRAR